MDRITPEQRISALIKAFEGDGYVVDREKDVFLYESVEPGSESFGIMARHSTATINGTKKKKKVFYLEGFPKEMGYMLGYLAEKDVSLMACVYVENFIWAFIKAGMKKRSFPHGRWPLILKRWFVKIINFILGIIRTVLKAILPGFGKIEKALDWLWKQLDGLLKDIVVKILDDFVEGKEQDIPKEYLEEMQGLYDGCKAANPKSKVRMDNLLILNIGIDVILSYVYNGIRLVKENRDVRPDRLEIPMMCNGFSVTGDAVEGDNHYMGRDFMFSTAGAFQDAACMIIYKPLKQDALPLVSVTAPGIVGSIAGMNKERVAVGVDISPSGWVNPERPGFNSLLLCRHSIQYGPTIEEAVERIRQAQRGVSWNYILADGKSQRACIVEATASTMGKDGEPADPHKQFPHHDLEDASFLDELIAGFSFHDNVKEALDLIIKEYPDIGREVLDNNGALVRWNDYVYPKPYLELNKRLFEIFGKEMLPGAMSRQGFINEYTIEKGIDQNTPYTFYFAPQRENFPDIVWTTNFFINPDMRYTVMNEWIARMFQAQTDDFQWRYDTLNALLLGAMEGNKITYEKARNIIDFLNPRTGKYPWYYGRKAKVIEGCISLFDLKAATVESHYGYYGDEWIKISLNNYLDFK